MASPASTFAWVGFILINVGIAILTTWGSSRHWVFGALVCGVYATCMIVAGYRIEKELKKIDRKKSSRAAGGNVMVSFEYKSRLALLVDLLFSVGVLALGVTGFIVSINVFSCGLDAAGGGNNVAGPQVGWITNTTQLPEDVKEWHSRVVVEKSEDNLPSFAFFPSSQTVLFSGKNGAEDGDDRKALWRSSDGGLPDMVSDIYNPTGFCRFESTECFAAVIENGLEYDTEYKVICTDNGVALRFSDATLHWPQHFYWSLDGILWLIADPPESKSYDMGIAYSLDPAEMTVQSHGVYLSGIDDDDDTAFNINDSLCGSAEKLRGKRAITAFFISALPTFLISVVLFLMEGIASLTVTAYFGFSACIVSLWIIFDGTSVDQMFDFLLDLNRYWFSWSSAIWLLLMCILVVIRRVKSRTFAWGINTSASLYFASMSVLFFYADPSLTQEWVRWLWINLLVYFPLAGLGVLYERDYLTILGAGVGVLLDIIKGSKILVAAMESFAPHILMFFLLFAVSGVVIGMIGWELSKRQESIQQVFFAWAQDKLLSFMPPEELMALTQNSEATPLRSKSYLSLT